ncbi:GYD domain-containing protein [Marinovum sp. 2_MG-2023]|uniref:GYD domain-containing protein n=1 Tax=unclassified Marinovum TaxID=2647166 RepID=UPI0026E1C1E2|nr:MULTISPECIES: GYD domain-containing protein [unclassified Marinovum]MDO6729271.1 GYD domain-containing protein [Marinovum sp. 2_MG-2023]MDO6779102.1 GYD domain-containing protein [Marinovum sp. 1_MG-2023]
MPTYYITEDVTREGMMTIDEAPERAKGVVAFAASMGVTVEEFSYCIAHFDFIMKVTAPDDETAAAFCMAVRRTGNVTAKMTRAFTPDEWGAMVAKLP